MSRKRQRKNEEEEEADDDSKDNTAATTTTTSSSSDKAGSKASSSSSSSDSITAFIRNTFNMVSDPSTDHIVRWSEDGLSFLVLDEFAFSKQLLPIYFRHRNFSSFVRQLNFYNFTKRQQDGRHTRLSHPCFRRGRIDLLHHIRRKSAHDGGAGSVKLAVSSLSEQVRELRGQYDDLFKIQQQILYIFSRYMRAHAGGEAGRGIRAVLGGARERLMLSGAGGDAAVVGGRRAASRGAHLSPIESDEAEDARFLHPHPNVELLEDGDEDGVNIQEMKEGEEAAEDDDAPGDDEEELGEGELEDDEQKAHNEATAQAFAELRSLQEMMNQLPSKQSFLSSIPAVTLPTGSPFRRSGSAAPPTSAAVSAAPPSAAGVAAAGAAPLLQEYANVFEPPSPSATKTAYNAFADNSAPVALPPLYPSDQHAPDHPAAAASSSFSSWSSAAPSSSSSTSSSSLSARRKANPKLLYSQEHYAAMEGRGGAEQPQPQQQRQRQPKREQPAKAESSSSSSLAFKLDEPPPPSPSTAPLYSPPSPMPLSAFPPSVFPAGDGYSPQRPAPLSQPSSAFISYQSPPLTPVSGNGWLTSNPSAGTSSSSSAALAVPGSAGGDEYTDMYGDAGSWANGAGVGMLPNLRADSLDSTDSSGRLGAEKAGSGAPSLYFSHY